MLYPARAEGLVNIYTMIKESCLPYNLPLSGRMYNWIFPEGISAMWDASSFDFVLTFPAVPSKPSVGCPRGVMVKAMDCGIVVSKFVLQSRSLSGKYHWERYERPYPPSYGLNSTTTDLLGKWLWHQIISKGWDDLWDGRLPILYSGEYTWY